MKEERLKALKRCLNMIQNAHDVLEEVRDEEQDAFDNLPEGLQYSATTIFFSSAASHTLCDMPEDRYIWWATMAPT